MTEACWSPRRPTVVGSVFNEQLTTDPRRKAEWVDQDVGRAVEFEFELLMIRSRPLQRRPAVHFSNAVNWKCNNGWGQRECMGF
jgi:hypothetical protein